MAEGKIELEIVTPKGRALAATVDEVTAPSTEGEFGVMPGHVPLLASLRTGLVSYRQGQTTKKCAVGEGFAEATTDKVVILTDAFIEKDTIDPVQVRKDLADTEAEFAKVSAKDIILAEGDEERRLLARKLNWLVTQLELCGEAPAATVRLLEELKEKTDAYDVEAEAPAEVSNDEATS
jgi:F-type H+-transporting ATPase subunit epsilon